MNSFNPSDPDFRNRVLSSFNNQGVMNTIGARIITIAPGKVEIDFGFHESLTQQHGYIHTAATYICPRFFSMKIVTPSKPINVVMFCIKRRQSTRIFCNASRLMRCLQGNN